MIIYEYDDGYYLVREYDDGYVEYLESERSKDVSSG